MPTLKLTKRAVEKLAAPDPSGKQVLYLDSEKRELGVRVWGVRTRKSWFMQGKHHGTTRRITLGPTSVLDPDQAWNIARPKLAEMLAGKDPKQERRKQANAAATVREVLEDYLSKSSRLSEASVFSYRHAAHKHL